MQKKPLYILIGLFILPILAAKLVLMNGWYQGANTNSGELITPPLSLPSVPQAWLLLYNPGQTCGQVCQQSLWQIQQVHTLLAAEGKRIQRYILANRTLTNPPIISNQTNNSALNIPQLALADKSREQLSGDTLYLVDPLGNVFMRYQFPGEKDAALSIAAGLLKDLKRLLKVSKIG
ncbi:MAG: hypothetical protein ACI86X_001212 [Moritella sp.]|jgi:hypothetical protein